MAGKELDKGLTVKFTSEKMSRNNLFKCHYIYTHVLYKVFMYDV